MTIFVSGCESDEELQRREFIRLETALQDLSTQEDPYWKSKLKAAELLELDYPQFREVQMHCVSAYKQYADGMKQLDKSEKYIRNLETALSNQNITHIEQKHLEAKKSVEVTAHYLKQAELLISQCVQMRQKYQQKLGVIVK